jgi:hypothetical protein
MNFDELRKSRFYQIGRWTNDQDTHESFLVEQAVYDTVAFDSKDISELKYRSWSNSGPTVCPSLFRLLDPHHMPEDIMRLVAHQWEEVTSIIDTVGKKSFNSILIIQPAGVTGPRHFHRPITKRTITFCYTYQQNKIVGDMKSKLRINFTDDEATVIMYPDAPKMLMLFEDNYLHQSVSYEWRFFWVYDFDTHVDIPEDVMSKMNDWITVDCSRSANMTASIKIDQKPLNKSV